jgi:hypothetical protein
MPSTLALHDSPSASGGNSNHGSALQTAEKK